MTSPQVSEQEVEAGAIAIDPWVFDPEYNASSATRLYRQNLARERSRAALTAAAQVRGKGFVELILSQAISQAEGYRESANSFGTDSQRDRAEKCAIAVLNSAWMILKAMGLSDDEIKARRAPLLRPTEPDSGPDVLGERKGIIGNFDEK